MCLVTDGHRRVHADGLINPSHRIDEKAPSSPNLAFWGLFRAKVGVRAFVAFYGLSAVDYTVNHYSESFFSNMKVNQMNKPNELD